MVLGVDALGKSPRLCGEATCPSDDGGEALGGGVGGTVGARVLWAPPEPRVPRLRIKTEAAGDAAQRLGQLRRDDPDLVRVALGDLREHLQVLVAEQLRSGRPRGSPRRPCRSPSPRPRRAGSRPSLRPPRAAWRHCFSPSAVEDLRLLEALRGEDRGALVALGAHLLLHRLLDAAWGVDRLQLHAVDPDAPFAGRLVQHPAQLRVDLVAGVSVSSSERPPLTLRRVVTVSCSMAWT